MFETTEGQEKGFFVNFSTIWTSRRHQISRWPIWLHKTEKRGD
jgi:hypothetical protein